MYLKMEEHAQWKMDIWDNFIRLINAFKSEYGFKIKAFGAGAEKDLYYFDVDKYTIYIKISSSSISVSMNAFTDIDDFKIKSHYILQLMENIDMDKNLTKSIKAITANDINIVEKDWLNMYWEIDNHALLLAYLDKNENHVFGWGKQSQLTLRYWSNYIDGDEHCDEPDTEIYLNHYNSQLMLSFIDSGGKTIKAVSGDLFRVNQRSNTYKYSGYLDNKGKYSQDKEMMLEYNMITKVFRIHKGITCISYNDIQSLLLAEFIRYHLEQDNLI